MAKAARLSGEEPDDEEYREFRAYMQGQKLKKKAVIVVFDACLILNIAQP
jgi:hypothetical protein